jgi:TPR repeat protein
MACLLKGKIHNRRLSNVVMSVLAGLAAVPQSAFADDAKIDLFVRPPAYSANFVCSTNQSLADIALRWKHWNGENAIPVNTETDMRIDAKRLASQDPRKFFDKTSLMFETLIKSTNPVIAMQAGIDRARLYIDAGRLTKGNSEEILKPVSFGIGSRNGSAMLILGEVYEKGIAVAADPAKSLEYYLKAAKAGQADALLRLTEMELSGVKTGLNFQPVTAMRLAFKGMMDNEVPDACVGIKRIARIYAKGTGVIKQDHNLASKWYELAANAGDVDSAWLVARYHLVGENIATDHELLRKYLSQAAEGGIAQAAVEIARAYEDGSLFDFDLDAARHWYNVAAERGSVFARVRLTRSPFLEKLNEQERFAALKTFADDPDAAPATLFSFAQMLIQSKGQEKGFDLARPYLERAATLNDFNSLQKHHRKSVR